MQWGCHIYTRHTILLVLKAIEKKALTSVKKAIRFTNMPEQGSLLRSHYHIVWNIRDPP